MAARLQLTNRIQQIYPIIHPQSTLPPSYQQKDQILCSRLRIGHRRIAPFLSYLSHTSVVTVAEICNSVGGGVLFDTPPRCRCPWRSRMSCSMQWRSQGGVTGGGAAPTKGLVHNFLCFMLFTSTTLLRVATTSTLR